MDLIRSDLPPVEKCNSVLVDSIRAEFRAWAAWAGSRDQRPHIPTFVFKN